MWRNSNRRDNGKSSAKCSRRNNRRRYSASIVLILAQISSYAQR
jgi:hypothetical protein